MNLSQKKDMKNIIHISINYYSDILCITNNNLGNLLSLLSDTVGLG